MGKRELLWLEKFGQSRYPQNSLYRVVYNYQKVTPDIRIKSLQDYLKIARFLVPDDEEMNRPTIRHPDLSPGNVLVSDSGEIMSMIDWQQCVVLPLFLEARVPYHFQNWGDEVSENNRPPKLPENFESLSDEDKAEQKEIYRRRQLHFFYLGHTSRINRRHYNAIRIDPYMYRIGLYVNACSAWKGDNVSLKAFLIRVIQHWSELRSQKAPPDCEIHYFAEEVKECVKHHKKQREIDRNMQGLCNFVGVDSEGLVENDVYEEAKEIAASLKAEVGRRSRK